MRRFYKTTFLSNEVPLQVFEVEESLTYLFRDTNVGTAYLFCVYIEDHQFNSEMHIKYPTMLVLQVVNMSFNHSLFIQKNDFDVGIPVDLIKDNSSIKGQQFCFHCFPLTLSFF